MRRFFVSLLFVMLLGCTSTQPADAAPPARDHVASAHAIESKTVALVQLDDDGALDPYCAGVWVSSTTILTAFHCVEDETVIGYATHEDVYPRGVKTPDAAMQARAGITYLVDEKHDLALVRAMKPPSGHDVAHLRVGLVQQGVSAETIGHPLGFWFSYSSGDVAAVRSIDLQGNGNDVLWVQCTTPTSPGNSGGGLFDSEGALFAVAARVWNEGQQLNWYVHPHYIAALLSTASKAGTL